MTQSGPIIDCIEETVGGALDDKAMVPADAWLRAEMRRIMWIIASDTQPYQNIPFIIQAMGEWGMVKASPTVHPLRLHFIRREFGALEGVLTRCAGQFAVGDEITLADCFLVPQVRNALLAAAGGIVQPLAFDEDKFEIYAAIPPDCSSKTPSGG